jgi:RNA polymerase sigma factor (sigma-70 family)
MTGGHFVGAQLKADASLNCRWPQDDRDLVFRVMSGEAAAFADLYRRYAGPVQAVLRSYVRNQDEVADLVQDVFTQALERLPTLRKPDRFRAWLFAITRHAAIDHRRTGPAGRFVALDEVAPPEQPGPGPAEVAELREAVRIFRGCIDRLSARDATALSLVARLGLGPAEVGTALGVTAGAAKVIVHRARRRLRTALLVEFFVRRRVPGCGTLEEVRTAGGLDPVARHLQGCAVCTALAGDRVGWHAAIAGARRRPATDTNGQ